MENGWKARLRLKQQAVAHRKRLKLVMGLLECLLVLPRLSKIGRGRETQKKTVCAGFIQSITRVKFLQDLFRKVITQGFRATPLLAPGSLRIRARR